LGRHRQEVEDSVQALTGEQVSLILGVGGLFVGLITAGLIPYLISLNTKQHNMGKLDRESQSKQLEDLLGNQHAIKTVVYEIKDDVVGLKDDVIAVKTDILHIKEKNFDERQQG